jgi:hypothetical protein
MADFSNGGRSRYDTSIPASVRHNNPGAMYPAPWMSKYGMQGHSIIGGGHKIAYFPNAIGGAAANLDLFERGYAGKTLGDAINKWSGGNSPGAYANSVASKLGVSSDTVITRDMLRDPKFGPGMMSAMASWEKGPKGQQFSLSPDQWQQAHAMYLGGEQRPQQQQRQPDPPSTPESGVYGFGRSQLPETKPVNAFNGNYQPAKWTSPNTVQWADGTSNAFGPQW